LRRIAGQPFSATKTLHFQVPWKFNILNSFTTFAKVAKFAKFAKFATFNPALEYPTPIRRHVPHLGSASERRPEATPPSPGSTGRVPVKRVAGRG
jgi:hypothetical protein